LTTTALKFKSGVGELSERVFVNAQIAKEFSVVLTKCELTKN
jgi:hypothetical protein